MARCSQITDEGLWNLLQRHLAFTELILDGLWNQLTFVSLKSMTELCPDVESLSLGFWQELKNEHLEILKKPEHFKKLRELNLEGCRKVTNEAAQELAKQRSFSLHLPIALEMS